MISRIREFLGGDRGIVKGAIGGVVATMLVVIATSAWRSVNAWTDAAFECRGVGEAALAQIESEGLSAFQRAEDFALNGDMAKAQYWFSLADGHFSIAGRYGSTASLRRRGILHTTTTAFILADAEIGSTALCRAAAGGDDTAQTMVDRADCASEGGAGW